MWFGSGRVEPWSSTARYRTGGEESSRSHAYLDGARVAMCAVVVPPQLRRALRGGVHSEQIGPSSCAHLHGRIPPPFSSWERQLGMGQ